MGDLVGRRLGDYEIVELLGQGAAGAVYRARQLSLDRFVAVRVLDPALAADPGFLERYREAVLASARLIHPNILRLYDLRHDGEVHYVVMDLAPGGSLRSRLAQGPLPLPEALELAAAVADALAYAHAHGVTHAALDPNDVLLDDAGHPLVADFGLDRALARPGSQTILPEYMTPEQAQGLETGPHTDLYALGLILFEAITGRPPFRGDTPLSVLYQQVNEPPPRLTSFGVQPPAVQELVDTALAKSPRHRFPSGMDMARALRHAAAQTAAPPEPTFPKPAPSRPRTGFAPAARPASRTPWVAVAALGAVGLFAAVAVLVLVAGQLLGGRGDETPVPATAVAVAAADTATAVPTSTPAPPTPTAPPTALPTATSSPTPTHTVTPSPMPTATPTPRPAGGGFGGEVKSAVTATPAETVTAAPSDTPTAVVDTPTPTFTATPAPTDTPTAEATATEPPLPAGFSGRIAYPLYDPHTGRTDVWVAQADGSHRYQLAPCMRQPDFRGDGVLAMNGEGCGTDSLWLMSADGSERREISRHPEDSHPTWSPDGSSVVYSSSQQGDGQWRLYAHSVLGEIPEGPPFLPLGSSGILGRSPVWLSNGEIAYNGCDYGFGSGGNCGLWVVSSQGGLPRRLTGDASDRAADEHGGNLVFMSTMNGAWDVYRIRLDGSDLTRLTQGSGNSGLPTWSPDGKAVAFLSDRDGQWAVWAMRPDGSQQHKLFDLNGTPGPQWTDERMSWGP
ncbi:MAG: serine/threonine-protein kinase [Anaerolineae bacterium]|nr:serine/threonine-protein kinase [Anaerolineae bacterium]